MKLEIFSPDEKIYEGNVNSVTFPGKEGQFQVLENHAPIFALLKKGEIVIENKKKISILSGIMELLNNQVIVLVKKEKMPKTEYNE